MNFQVRLPDDSRDLALHEEYFFLTEGGKEERKVRLHDYPELYRIPGLYEYMALSKLEYKSPDVIPALLKELVTQANMAMEDLIVLDIGAGSGLMSKGLANLGVKSITGIDILPEAAEAAKRDYPELYEDYYVEDLTDLRETTDRKLKSKGFNCLMCSSALSFGHIPALGFVRSLNFVVPNGWIVFNVRGDFFEKTGSPEFIELYARLLKENILEISTKRIYQHRLAMNGTPIEYMAIVARKKAPVPENL